MKFRVDFHDLFESDVDTYVDWFNEVAPGLGADLAAALDSAVDKLAERPHSFSLMGGSYRRVLIARFSIIIPFVVEDSTVYVVGVVHTSRDLEAWFRRRLIAGDE